MCNLTATLHWQVLPDGLTALALNTASRWAILAGRSWRIWAVNLLDRASLSMACKIERRLLLARHESFERLRDLPQGAHGRIEPSLREFTQTSSNPPSGESIRLLVRIRSVATCQWSIFHGREHGGWMARPAETNPTPNRSNQIVRERTSVDPGPSCFLGHDLLAQ